MGVRTALKAFVQTCILSPWSPLCSGFCVLIGRALAVVLLQSPNDETGSNQERGKHWRSTLLTSMIVGAFAVQTIKNSFFWWAEHSEVRKRVFRMAAAFNLLVCMSLGLELSGLQYHAFESTRNAFVGAAEMNAHTSMMPPSVAAPLLSMHIFYACSQLNRAAGPNESVPSKRLLAIAWLNALLWTVSHDVLMRWPVPMNAIVGLPIVVINYALGLGLLRPAAEELISRTCQHPSLKVVQVWVISSYAWVDIVCILSSFGMLNFVTGAGVMREAPILNLHLAVSVSWNVVLACVSTAADEAALLRAEKEGVLAELETHKALSRAKEASATARARFTRYIFHEVRVPFNSIFIGLALMNEEEARLLSADGRATLQMLLRASDSMKTILNDCLDFAKIESGAFQVCFGPTDLRDLVHSTLLSLQPFASDTETRVELVLYVDPCVPECLLADKVRLQQVVANLVSNAIKFSPHDGSGRVRINVLALSGDDIAVDRYGNVHVSSSAILPELGLGLQGVYWCSLHDGVEAASTSAATPIGISCSDTQTAQVRADRCAGLLLDTGRSRPLSPACASVPGPLRLRKAGSASSCGSHYAGSLTDLHPHVDANQGTTTASTVQSETSIPIASPTRGGLPVSPRAVFQIRGPTPDHHTVGSPGHDPGTLSGRARTLLAWALQAVRTAVSTACDMLVCFACAPISRCRPSTAIGENYLKPAPVSVISEVAAFQPAVEQRGLRTVRSAAGEVFYCSNANDDCALLSGPAAPADSLPRSCCGCIPPLLPMQSATTAVLSGVASGGYHGDLAALVSPAPSPDSCLVLISVSDNGNGVPTSDFSVIFEAFKQLDAGLQYKGKGTGLGLAICKEIVAKHGGRIGLRSSSEVGQGAEFIIALRLPALSGRPWGRTSQQGLGGTGQGPLCVDQDMIGHPLGVVGAGVSCGAAGTLACCEEPTLAGRRQQRTGQGTGDTRNMEQGAVSAVARLQRFVPLHAVGASSSSAGPCSPTAGHSVLYHFEDRSDVRVRETGAEARPRQPALPPAVPRGIRILVVDDVRDNRRLLLRSLRSKLSAHASTLGPMVMQEAEDGHEAVATVLGCSAAAVLQAMAEPAQAGAGGSGRRNSAVVAFMNSLPSPLLATIDQDTLSGYDVVTMDAEMPTMSGFVAARLLRLAGFRGAIFGCTGNALEEDQRLFLSAGVDRIFTKPIAVAQLADAILKHARSCATV